MSIDLSQFNDAFFEEALGYLDQAEDDLLRLEKAPLNPDDCKTSIDSAFRAIHSIKGSAGSLGFLEIDRLSHALETVLELFRQQADPAGKGTTNVDLNIGVDTFDLLLSSVDLLRVQISSAQSKSGDVSPSRVNALIAKLEHVNSASTSDSSNTFDIQLVPSQAMLDSGNDPLRYIDTLAALGSQTIKAYWDDSQPHCYLSWVITLKTNRSISEIEAIFEWIEDVCQFSVNVQGVIQETKAHRTTDVVEIDAPIAKATTIAKEASAKQVRTIQVRPERIDELMGALGELAIYQAEIENKLQSQNANQETSELFVRLARQTSGLQDAIMAMRMSPIHHLFSRFERTVRDAQVELGKEVHLIVEGENAELDSSMIERLIDPLTHLIRNALDHGVETPDFRVSIGKPRSAKLTLKAEQHSNAFLISIEDDGKGFDIEAIKQRAIEKKIAKEADTKTDSQWANMIFVPGFSTTTQVSRWSGRGVGLDVVLKEIEKIKGQLDIHSSPGVGTRFVISIPLTLALSDALIIRSGDDHYAVILSAVKECIQATASRIETLPNQQQLYRLRDELLPYAALPDLMSGEVPSSGKTEEHFPAIVIRSGQHAALLQVSEIIGQRQIVIKSHEKNLGTVKYCESATVLPNGTVAFVLNANTIVRAVGISEEAL
jgi:two-component system, chemotaxis family, sensor kinase CheA